MERDEPMVDLGFPLAGTVIPADHGYALLGAIARRLPEAHGDERLAIHPIAGKLVGGRRVALTPRSRLIVRVPLSLVPAWALLAGQELDLDGNAVQVGLPTVRSLEPAPTLRSRLVVIKGYMEAEPFLAAARRQLAERGIGGEPALLLRQAGQPVEGGSGGGQPLVKRSLRIRDREVVGYALAVTGLTAEESLQLQAVGVGGRRRFGCGVFVPWP